MTELIIQAKSKLMMVFRYENTAPVSNSIYINFSQLNYVAPTTQKAVFINASRNSTK